MAHKACCRLGGLGACPPPPRNCWYSEVNSGGFWGCLFVLEIEGVKIGVCGFAYMYVHESAKHAVCSYVFLKYLIMDIRNYFSRKRSRKEVDDSDSAIFFHTFKMIGRRQLS